MRIMMSAASSVVAPGIINHLKSLGHYVIGHDCRPYPAIGADRFIQSPKVTSSYREFLIDCLSEYDLYLPFLDEELAILEQFSGKVLLSPSHAIFTSKWRQQGEMQKAGLPVAPLNSHFELPAIAKPEFGHGGNGIIRVETQRLYRAVNEDGYLVQKFIDGDEYTIDVLTGWSGEFLYAVPRRRIATNGVSTIGRIEADQGLIDLARRVTKAFAFRGPINIQIIRERSSGTLYIIEVNARLSGSCMFTVMAGFDILDATIRLFQCQPFVPPVEVKEITVRRHYVEEII